MADKKLTFSRWQISSAAKTRLQLDGPKLSYASRPALGASKQLWARGLLHDTAINVRAVEWYVECALAGARLLRDSVVVDPDQRGGVPVLTGTGFTVSQTLVELADSSGVAEVADEFDLDADVIRKMLNGLSLLLEKPHSS
jgi:uncharacterized protein (DUF433 family)